MEQCFKLYPIGKINHNDDGVFIEVYEKYVDALLGIDDFSHLVVCYWFHKNDTPNDRSVLRVHPRGNENNPLTGVFGTHSPRRPNLIAISLCKKLAMEQNIIYIDNIDALDGSPVVDIKPLIPSKSIDNTDVKVADWV
jgi:tRNA-Thr(GGU) m(6)t(6)A37 methyltransferase TsaA